MSCKNTNKKTTTGSKFNINSITGLLNIILTAFDIPKEPLTPLPPPLLLVGANLRTGLSPSTIASRIISRQSEAGLIVGDVFGDGPNSQEAMWVIAMEEIVNSIQTEAKVEMVVPPGIAITAVGASPFGPVVSQGMTTTLGIGSGVVR